MIYALKNDVQHADGRRAVRFTKVYAVDDEMARAVSRALCSADGMRVLEQWIVSVRSSMLDRPH
jgi:hypothetical protein